MRGRRADGDDRGGFVVAVVVFVLFAVGVAAALAYQLVRLEAELAAHEAEGLAALAAAAAGLERYVGEQYGLPADSASYVVGGHPVSVTARRIAAVDADTHLYHLRSEGRVEDSRWSASPARRIVQQYALLHRDPIGLESALLVAAGFVSLADGARVDGMDAALPGQCPDAGVAGRIGLASTGTFSDPAGGLEGSPPHVVLADHQTVVDTAAVRWDVLSSPDFAIRHDGTPPAWSTIPPDSFPVVRATGDLAATSGWSGRGVLVVPGTFTMAGGFEWDGIVLAGRIGDLTGTAAGIRGMLVGGFDPAQDAVDLRRVEILWHSCNVDAAAASIAYLELLPGTWNEGS